MSPSTSLTSDIDNNSPWVSPLIVMDVNSRSNHSFAHRVTFLFFQCQFAVERGIDIVGEKLRWKSWKSCLPDPTCHLLYPCYLQNERSEIRSWQSMQVEPWIIKRYLFMFCFGSRTFYLVSPLQNKPTPGVSVGITYRQLQCCWSLEYFSSPASWLKFWALWLAVDIVLSTANRQLINYYPYPRHVRGFHRIAPLICEKKNKNDKRTGNFSVHHSGQYPSGTSEGGVLPLQIRPGLPPPTSMGVPQSSTTVADPTETFGSIMGQLPLEGMTLNTNPSDESTARVLHKDVTVPAE